MDNRSRLKQAWAIAKIEMGRAFFSKRAFWVYGLALFPCIIFFGHTVVVKIRRQRLSTQVSLQPALRDTLKIGESYKEVLQRLGKPPLDRYRLGHRRVFRRGEYKGITIHKIQPVYEARFIKLNIFSPAYNPHVCVNS